MRIDLDALELIREGQIITVKDKNGGKVQGDYATFKRLAIIMMADEAAGNPAGVAIGPKGLEHTHDC